MLKNNKIKFVLFVGGIITVSVAISAILYFFIVYGNTFGGAADVFAESILKENTELQDIEIDEPFDKEPQNLGSFFEMAAFLESENKKLSSWVSEFTPMYASEETAVETEAQYYKPRVAYCYLDFMSGNSICYGEDEVFFSASIIKQPYILYVLKEIERAEAENEHLGTKYDVNRIFTYAEDNYVEGSGIIQNQEFGATYTYLDLLKLSITQSDNIAFKEVRHLFGNKEFSAFSEKLGTSNPQKKFYSISAADAIKYLSETYTYFMSESKYSSMLKDWMQSTNHRILIPSAVRPSVVASKYGWDEDSYHDMAIVFDKHPYALVILTELESGTNEDNIFIRKIASKINDIHKACDKYR